jgi:hypothetical protein
MDFVVQRIATGMAAAPHPHPHPHPHRINKDVSEVLQYAARGLFCIRSSKPEGLNAIHETPNVGALRYEILFIVTLL